eukprot:1178362-Prorocentrum_minimum.AAC.1
MAFSKQPTSLDVNVRPSARFLLLARGTEGKQLRSFVGWNHWTSRTAPIPHNQQNEHAEIRHKEFKKFLLLSLRFSLSQQLGANCFVCPAARTNRMGFNYTTCTVIALSTVILSNALVTPMSAPTVTGVS